MALDPDFPTNPYVYVLYTYDHQLGVSEPHHRRWGDTCPTPPGPTSDGCVVSGRLSRLEASGNVMTGSEQVLIEDWCQQYPSHSVGTVDFGPDGALYASAGDGASFNFTDYGQDGSPLNPCGDPPGGVGGPMTPPSAEGGALRSQDLRTSGDPTTLDGSIIRVDPATGAALPSNPLFGNPDANARRIIAHGLRNPFRFTSGRARASSGSATSAGTSTRRSTGSPTRPTRRGELRLAVLRGQPQAERLRRRQPRDLREPLPLAERGHRTVLPVPPLEQGRRRRVLPDGQLLDLRARLRRRLPEHVPAAYQGALFFSDYSRDCIWAMKTGGGSTPSPGPSRDVRLRRANPVNLQFGPGGDLFYADFDGGTIRRIHFVDTTTPTVTSTTPTNGATGVGAGMSPTATFSEPIDPATVTSSTFRLFKQGVPTPIAATISYDGPSRTATLNPDASLEPDATYAVTVKGGVGGVEDLDGNTLASDVSWTFQTNGRPVPVIDTPGATLTWHVGELVSFSGHATDPEQGTLPASSLSWTLLLQHCPSNCHSHTVQTWNGVATARSTRPSTSTRHISSFG